MKIFEDLKEMLFNGWVATYGCDESDLSKDHSVLFIL